MQLTAEDLRTAVHADSHSYAVLRGRIAELQHEGREREANALQADYDERLGRWKDYLENLMQCPQNQ